MTAKVVDEEKGEAGLKTSENKAKPQTDEPASPKSSQASTFVDRTARHSDSRPSTSEAKVSRWAQWTYSFASLFGVRRKPKPDDHNRVDCDNSDDDDSEEDSEQFQNESVIRKIHEQPKGYPKFATFLDSDESFMIYRRFGYLQSRLLLDRQEELRDLENQLDLMENQEHKTSPGRLESRRYRSEEKKQLLASIETTWNAYCQLLVNACSVTALNKPTSSEQSSVAKWLWNVKGIRTAETHFLHRKEDLITLRPGREHAWLDSGVEKMLQWFGCGPVRRAFQSKDTREKSDGTDGTVLYTRSRIENFVISILGMGLLVLLVVPIWILYRLTEPENESPRASSQCIGVLLVSTLAFSACISLFTKARRHEILAASAGYCAVLVVFVGNIGHV